MLRFTTAVVTKAACRSLASSAMLHCLQAATVAFEEREKECKPNYFHRSAFALHGEGGSGGVEVERNASNTSSVGSVSEHNNAAPLVDFDGFRGATKPTVSDVPQVPAKSEQSKDCRARLEALLVKLDSGDAAVAELREATRLACNEIKALRTEKAELEEKCGRLESDVPIILKTQQQRSYDIIAEALRIVDQDFQRRFKTSHSLLNIWHTPRERRDEEAKRALNDFLKENEQLLSLDHRSVLFEAWDMIRYRCDSFPQLREDVRTLDQDKLKAALVLCCGEWSEGFRKSLLEVILRAFRRMQ